MKLRQLGIIGAAGALAVSAAVPTFAQAPEDELGVVSIPAGEPVHIAFWGVLTGSDSTLGIDSQRGIEIALEDRDNMVLDRQILLTLEDAGCNSEGGSTAATKLAADTTVVGLIGSSCSSETAGGIAAINGAGLTTISSSATRPQFTQEDVRAADPNLQAFTRTAHSDAFQGLAVANWAYENGITTAATIHDGSPYAEALQQVFADAFTELGGTITKQEAVTVGQTDMNSVLTDIGADQPQLIYLPIFAAEGAAIVSQVRDIAGLENARLAGSDGLFSPNFVSAAGPNVVGMYLSSPDFSAFGAEAYADFLEKHQAKYGEAPVSAFHAHAYDAVGILLAAIEKVAITDADGTTHIGKKALRDAIYATTDYPGIIGTLSCSPTGDCGAPAIGVYELTEEVVSSGAMPTVPVWSNVAPAESPAP